MASLKRVGMRLIQVVRSLLVALFPPVLLSQEGKVGMGVGTPDVPEPSTSSSSSSSISTTFEVGTLFNFFDQWRSITSNMFVLNMVRGHHLQLRSHSPLFRDFWHFNIKVAAAHHPVIQKEVDELLAKGAIETYSSSTGFYSSMFVVPKHTGGICPILNLKHFNCFMHIPSFKMPTLKRVWQLIQQGDYTFSIDLQDDLIYMFPLLSIIVVSYVLSGIMCLINGRFYLLGLPQPLGFLHPSQNLFCSFAIAKVCILLSISMTSWSSFTPSGQVRGCTCFCVPCWSILVYILIFSSQTFTSLSPLLSWGYVGILFARWYLYLLIS